jgi:carbonic anhydrase
LKNSSFERKTWVKKGKKCCECNKGGCRAKKEEKELQVEIVMALRGLYPRIEELEVAHEELDDEVWNLKKGVKGVKTEAVRRNLELATMRLQKHQDLIL